MSVSKAVQLFEELKELYNDPKLSSLQKRQFYEVVNGIISGKNVEEVFLKYTGKLSDVEILELCKAGMLDPFVDHKVKQDYSYGIEPAGYTLRVGQTLTIAPKSYGLIHTLETINTPQDIVPSLYNKSSYTRQGVIGHFAAIEPGYRGQLTLCFQNLGEVEVTLKEGNGIAQIQFERLSCLPKSIYEGKYQDSKGVVKNENKSKSS